MPVLLPPELRAVLEEFGIIDRPRVPAFDKLAEAITKRHGAYRTATNLEKITVAAVGLPGGDAGLVWVEVAAVDPGLALCEAFCGALKKQPRQGTLDLSGAAKQTANPASSQPGEEDLGDAPIDVEVIELPAASIVEDGWHQFDPRPIDRDRWLADGLPGGVRHRIHQQGSGEYREDFHVWEIKDGYQYVPDVGSGPGWIAGGSEPIAPKWGHTPPAEETARPRVLVLYLDEQLGDGSWTAATDDDGNLADWQDAGELVEDLEEQSLRVAFTAEQEPVLAGALDRGLGDVDGAAGRAVLIRIEYPDGVTRQGLGRVQHFDIYGDEADVFFFEGEAPAWYELPTGPSRDEQAPEPWSVLARPSDAETAGYEDGWVFVGTFAEEQPAAAEQVMIRRPGEHHADVIEPGAVVDLVISGDTPARANGLTVVSRDYAGAGYALLITFAESVVDRLKLDDAPEEGDSTEETPEAETPQDGDSGASETIAPDAEEDPDAAPGYGAGIAPADEDGDEMPEPRDLSNWTLGAAPEDVARWEAAAEEIEAEANGEDLDPDDHQEMIAEREAAHVTQLDAEEEDRNADPDPELVERATPAETAAADDDDGREALDADQASRRAAEDEEDLETARIDRLVETANAAGYNLRRVEGGRDVVDVESNVSMSREWLEKQFGRVTPGESPAVAVPKIEKPKRKSRKKTADKVE